MTVDYFNEALIKHKLHKGKVEIHSKFPLITRDDLSTAYTPGVAQPCLEIAKNKEDAYLYTWKGNSVAVISDGSAVLGLGNIGGLAGLPVMEGKAVLFKAFANIDAVPVVLSTQNTDQIVNTVIAIAPTYGGINLEDIAAPRCFEVERRLKEALDIPVFHDDQHGTAVVVMAALLNACKVTGKEFNSLNIVINGAGAAGIAIAKLIKITDKNYSVHDIILCDSVGIVSRQRSDLNDFKLDALTYTNKHNKSGSLIDAMIGADVFIGVSKANTVTESMVRSMAKNSIVLAMANPIPEIMPNLAKAAGAMVVGTGRSDFPNQVNNVLGFPGIFRGALDAKATCINEAMKIAAAKALAAYVHEPTTDNILPYALDKGVALAIAQAVKNAAIESGVVRK